MTLTMDKVHAGMDLADLLLPTTEETDVCQRNQTWSISIDDTLSPEASTADDFLEALLGGSETSSIAASPLWSPCTTDSGINDDPVTDPTESFCTSTGMDFPSFKTPSYCQPGENQLSLNEAKPHVSIDLGWDSSGELKDQFGIAYYLTTNHQASPSSAPQPLTVKDLLLSDLRQKAEQIPQNSLQNLVLNEDEKRLLAKEGVNLPSKLPLSKFEERVLKKIRRKIRNKHSAQESRKKKREYVDSLEGRMSACNSNNLELQRKIQKLEETNTALLEQLSQLQALLPNSVKTTHRGTCILVLLLSFSLIISSNLQPEPYSQLSQGDYMLTKAPSRSLQSINDRQDGPLLPDTEVLTVDRLPYRRFSTLSPPG